MADADGPFVGAEEARQILGIPLSLITRWYKNGKLPAPYSTPKCSPIWFREDIERWRNGARDGFHEPPAEMPILGVKEAAELIGVNKSQIGRWLREPPKSSPQFPDPVQTIKAGRLWTREAIVGFLAPRRRPVAAPAAS